ncbi:MAG TPA: DNA methyltransferase [Capsulimonadaceae bacterium]|jgi:modification methylase
MLNPIFKDQVIHGDCVEVMNSLPEKSVDLIFADPPYNLQLSQDLFRPNLTLVDAVDDNWDKFGSFAEYDEFTRNWLSAARHALKDDGTLWVIGSYHNIYRVGAILMDLGFWILNDIAWIKTNPLPQMMGSRFCNSHETLLWAKKTKTSTYTFHYRDIKSGNEDKQMRSDWRFPLCTGRERITIGGQKAHATQKPEALLHRIIAATSNPGDLVLDPFCGSGTTAAVAKRLGRHFITVDREESYVGVAEKRVAHIKPLVTEEIGPLIDDPKPRVPFAHLVESGKIPVGAVLTFRRTGKEAIVNADGTITWEGNRGSIHKIACLCAGMPSCNGWIHWFFTNPKTGEVLPLDVLRAKLNDDSGQLALWLEEE